MTNKECSLSGSIKAKSTLTCNLVVVANFAWQHLKAATLFRDQVIRIETENAGEPFGAFFEEIRSYTSACILSTAASLEALINELFIDPNLRLRPMLSDFENEFWGDKGIEKKYILGKYKRALSMLNAKPFDENKSAYRDMYALIELRNALVHYKPTWDPDRKKKVELVELLKDKFPYSPFANDSADFITMKCMGSGCARWVINTAFAFIHEFDALSNLSPDKMSGFWMLEM